MTKPKDPKKKLTAAQRRQSFKERWKVRKLNEEKVKLAIADAEFERQERGEEPLSKAGRRALSISVRKGMFIPMPGGRYLARFGGTGTTGKLESMEPTSPGSGRLGNVTAPQGAAYGFPSVRTPPSIARGAAMLNRRTTDTQPDKSRAERISRTEGLIDTIQTLQANHELDEVLAVVRAKVQQIQDGLNQYSSRVENMDAVIVNLGRAIRAARSVGNGWGEGRPMPPFDPAEIGASGDYAQQETAQQETVQQETARK